VTKEQHDYEAKKSVLAGLLARMMIRKINETPGEYTELTRKWAADLDAILTSEETNA
jgi:hypothetical protein